MYCKSRWGKLFSSASPEITSTALFNLLALLFPICRCSLRHAWCTLPCFWSGCSDQTLQPPHVVDKATNIISHVWNQIWCILSGIHTPLTCGQPLDSFYTILYMLLPCYVSSSFRSSATYSFKYTTGIYKNLRLKLAASKKINKCVRKTMQISVFHFKALRTSVKRSFWSLSETLSPSGFISIIPAISPHRHVRQVCRFLCWLTSVGCTFWQ